MSAGAVGSEGALRDLDVDLNHLEFLADLITMLAGSLERVAGLDEASAYVSLVSDQMGEKILAAYRQALGSGVTDPSTVPAVLVDLKARIGGDFYVIEETSDRIVLGNRRCPFGDAVIGKPSLCRMTSGVFGGIAAEVAGHARVQIEESIAQGDRGCRIVVELGPGKHRTHDEGVDSADYFKVETDSVASKTTRSSRVGQPILAAPIGIPAHGE